MDSQETSKETSVCIIDVYYYHNKEGNVRYIEMKN